MRQRKMVGIKNSHSWSLVTSKNIRNCSEEESVRKIRPDVMSWGERLANSLTA